MQDENQNRQDAFRKLATESWRFVRVFEKALQDIDEKKRKRYASRLDWYEKQIDAAMETFGCQFVDLAGKPYDAGVAATPLNLNDFDAEESLVVDYMMEPTILDADGHVIQTGTAMLRRAEK